MASTAVFSPKPLFKGLLLGCSEAAVLGSGTTVSFMNYFWSADWDGLYRILAKGNPPLALQLLAVNTLFLVFYIVRQATAKHRMRNQTVEVIQLFLLVANLGVVFQEDAYRWISTAVTHLLT